MAGFLISNLDINVECQMDYPDKSFKKDLKYNDYNVKQSTSNKFIDDKICEEREKNIFVIEGVILNKKSLMEKYELSQWGQVLEKMSLDNECYFNDFRGTFSGAFYKKDKDEWLIYTNHLGDHQVFYWENGESFIVSSDLNWLVDALKQLNIEYSFNEEAFKSILSYGWVYGNMTMINEVKKLLPGTFLRINNKKIVEIKRYHLFENTKYNKQTEEEIIEEIDKRFRKAVALEYEKDKEYGYEHFALLSGGLDSRMSLWVANDMGYKVALAITFGQSQGDDIKVSNQIAAKLRIPHLIKTLDDFNSIEKSNILRKVKRSFGLIDVSGTINAYFEKILNTDNNGLIHGGLIGDAILASLWEHHKKPSGSIVGAINNVVLVKYNSIYKNEELEFIYNRVSHWTLGCQCTTWERLPYASVFLDIDFMEYCFSIPLKYRYNHYIYIKWILQKYPEAAEFIWEKTGCKINDNEVIKKFRKIRKNVERKFNNVDDKNLGMNPFDYWYDIFPEVRKEMKELYDLGIKNKCISMELKKVVDKLYRNKECLYKIQIISALLSVNLYFGEE